MNKINITSASNTEAPSYKILKDYGFSISKLDNMLIAEKEDMRLSAESFLELLGLCNLINQRGADWKVEDKIIEEMISLFMNE